MSHEYRIKQLRAAIRLPGNSQKSYKFFCRGLDIRVSEVVKSDVRQSRVLQDLLVQVYDGVWVVHLAGCRRGKHVGILRMLAMLCYQQIDGILRNGYFSN